MLTARSIVITVAVVAVLLLISMCISLIQPPDSGGKRQDTYGTRAYGHRALFEILTELDVPVERLLVPPDGALHRDITLVFWGSDSDLVQLEPVYLQKVAQWVREGGRVVVAPARQVDLSKTPKSFARSHSPDSEDTSIPKKDIEETSILKELGLEDINLRLVTLAADVDADETIGRLEIDPIGENSVAEEDKSIRRRFEEAFYKEVPDRRTLTVKLDGEVQLQAPGVSSLVVEETMLQVIDVSNSNPTGRALFQWDDGLEYTLAASFRLGQGEIIVVSDPALFYNRFITHGDNVLLACHLLAASDRTIVFDEFYHGLTIRGNPLWLITRRSYGLLALIMLATVGLFIWRQSVFLGPPSSELVPSRRTLAEYVESMARLFRRGKANHRFLLREVRDGILWTLRGRLKLNPGQEDIEHISAALARKDPEAAKKLVHAVDSINAMLSENIISGEKQTLSALQRISNCL